MAKVKVKATQEDFEQADKDQGEFVLPKPGYYILQLKECNPGHSKGPDGEEDKSKPRLECIYEIVGVGVEDAEPSENYGNVWDYISFSKDSGFARARFLKAMNLASGDGDAEADVETDADKPGSVIATKVLARLKITPARGTFSAKAKVASLLPYSERNTVDGTNDAFGGVEDSDDDDDTPAEDNVADGDDYTEEELSGMELKELGAVAKDDFELDPNTFIVKARGGKVNNEKTKAALIAGILAAQDGDDDGGSNDNPF